MEKIVYEHQPYYVTTVTKMENEIVEINTDIQVAETVNVMINRGVTTVVLGDGSKGKSKWNPSDIYDAQKGTDIALLRARMKQTAKQLKQLMK